MGKVESRTGGWGLRWWGRRILQNTASSYRRSPTVQLLPTHTLLHDPIHCLRYNGLLDPQQREFVIKNFCVYFDLKKFSQIFKTVSKFKEIFFNSVN